MNDARHSRTSDQGLQNNHNQRLLSYWILKFGSAEGRLPLLNSDDTFCVELPKVGLQERTSEQST
jgi:hypothetical protein